MPTEQRATVCVSVCVRARAHRGKTTTEDDGRTEVGRVVRRLFVDTEVVPPYSAGCSFDLVRVGWINPIN